MHFTMIVVIKIAIGIIKYKYYLRRGQVTQRWAVLHINISFESDKYNILLELPQQLLLLYWDLVFLPEAGLVE